MNSLLSIEEVKNYLQIEQEEIERYITQGKLHAYKIGGTYIRFRKEEVLNLRLEVGPKKKKNRPPLLARIADFWRFNNFYIVSLILIVILISLLLNN